MPENDEDSTPNDGRPRNTWNYEVPDGRLVHGDLPTEPGEDRSTAEPAPPPPAAPPQAPAGSASETVIVPTPAPATPSGAAPAPTPRAQPPGSGGVSRRLVGLVWLVAFVIAGAAVILLLTRDDGDDRVVAVPDLTDVDEETARELLDELGLTLGSVSAAPGAPGVVVFQDPAPGSELSPGGSVDLTIGGDGAAGGSGEIVELPDVVGRPEDEARRALAAVGAIDVSTNAVESDEPPGTVLEQDPAPGRVPADTPVVLTVAAAPGDMPVPDVGGLAVGDAQALLEAAGFTVELVEASSGTVAAGGLIGTDPRPGSVAPPGSIVRLLVSTGPESVAVPDVVGDNAFEALGALQAVGLTATTTVCRLTAAEADQAGSIIEQTPPGGATVDPGSEVSVCVGAAPEPTPTPVPTATPRPRPTATPRPAPTATPTQRPTATPPPDCPIDDETCR